MYLKGTKNCHTVRTVRANLATIIAAKEPTIVLNSYKPAALILPVGDPPWNANADQQAAYNANARKLLYEALSIIEVANGTHDRLVKKNQRTNEK